MNIEAVIFDFGGVLYEIDYHAPVQAFEKLGCENFDSLYSKAQQSELQVFSAVAHFCHRAVATRRPDRSPLVHVLSMNLQRSSSKRL